MAIDITELQTLQKLQKLQKLHNFSDLLQQLPLTRKV